MNSETGSEAMTCSNLQQANFSRTILLPRVIFLIVKTEAGNELGEESISRFEKKHLSFFNPRT